jgi:hypothetical protein
MSIFRPKVKLPPPRAALRLDGKELELVMHEYDAIRGEILVTLSNQVSTLSFGAATVGLLVAATAALWKDAELLSGLLLLLIVPMVCFLTLAIYSGEQVRLMRAGLFINRLENCVNHAGRSRGGALLTWEQWQEIRAGSGDVDAMNRIAITLVFALLAVGFIAMGFWRLHTTKMIPEWLAVELTALAALVALASTAWVAWLKRYAYEHRRHYKYTARGVEAEAEEVA